MFRLLKGWLGERGAQFGMWMGLNGKVYRRVHDVIIPAKFGTTQIDHILVSVYGVFVVETKNMDGWIFGDEKAPKWTQCIFGKKFSFQNPLHQNHRHICALAEFLDYPQDIFHSVVFFIGECELKTQLPENVLTRGVSRYIQSFTEQILPPGEAMDILAALIKEKEHPVATRSQHVVNLQTRHNGTECPKCGGGLILRTGRRGANAGGQFYGCATYPNCRYTRKV